MFTTWTKITAPDNCDGLSFFDVILPSYVKNKPRERVLKKIRFSHAKLSAEGVEIVAGMVYDPVEHDGISYDLRELIGEAIKAD